MQDENVLINYVGCSASCYILGKKEFNVKCKDYGIKPICNANCNGRSFDTKLKFYNQSPTEKQVQQAGKASG